MVKLCEECRDPKKWRKKMIAKETESYVRKRKDLEIYYKGQLDAIENLIDWTDC